MQIILKKIALYTNKKHYSALKGIHAFDVMCNGQTAIDKR